MSNVMIIILDWCDISKRFFDNVVSNFDINGSQIINSLGKIYLFTAKRLHILKCNNLHLFCIDSNNRLNYLIVAKRSNNSTFIPIVSLNISGYWKNRCAVFIRDDKRFMSGSLQNCMNSAVKSNSLNIYCTAEK